MYCNFERKIINKIQYPLWWYKYWWSLFLKSFMTRMIYLVQQQHFPLLTTDTFLPTRLQVELLCCSRSPSTLCHQQTTPSSAHRKSLLFQQGIMFVHVLENCIHIKLEYCLCVIYCSRKYIVAKTPKNKVFIVIPSIEDN